MTGAGVLQVVAILEQTRSSYLPTFLSLRKAIQQEAVVAEDNLKFLQCLEQPCHTLASATAKVGSSYMPRCKTFPDHLGCQHNRQLPTMSHHCPF